MKKILYLGFGLLLSCTSEIHIEGFDKTAWKSDKMGCQGVRQTLLPIIDKNKDKLIDVSEKQILELLGKPDRIELAQRNQRFFYYFVERGAQCDSALNRLGKQLYIRISSIEVSNEVSFTTF